MIALLDPRLWGAAIIALLLSFAAGDFHGEHAASAKAELKEVKTDNAALIVTGQISADLTKSADHIDAQANKVDKNAQAQTVRGHAALASGAVSLHCPSAVAPSAPADPAAGPATEGAELVQAASERIYQIGRDGDDAVRGLNQCIARYNAVRDEMNKEPAD